MGGRAEMLGGEKTGRLENWREVLPTTDAIPGSGVLCCIHGFAQRIGGRLHR